MLCAKIKDVCLKNHLKLVMYSVGKVQAVITLMQVVCTVTTVFDELKSINCYCLCYPFKNRGKYKQVRNGVLHFQKSRIYLYRNLIVKHTRVHSLHKGYK